MNAGEDRRRALMAMTVMMRAGEVMLESAMAVSDVDLSLRRMARGFELERCQVSVTLNMIVLSYVSPRFDEPLTLMSSVDNKEPRVDRLVAMERLARRIGDSDIDLEDAYDEIVRIEESEGIYRAPITLVAAGVSVAGWIVFAGGSALAVLAALVAWLMYSPLSNRLQGGGHLPIVFVTFVCALLTAGVPYAAAAVDIPLETPAAIAGGLYPLLPGGLLVASITDGLFGAPLSSLAKGLQAVVAALALALGVLLASEAAVQLDVDTSVPPHQWPAIVTALGAGLGLGGLAVARSAPWQISLGAASLGMVAWLVTWFASELDAPRVAGTFLASVAMGAGGQVLGRLRGLSATSHTGLAVYSLVPGLTLFQAIQTLVLDERTAAADFALTAVQLATAIAAGIALGTVLAAAVRAPSSPTRLWRRPPRPPSSGRS